MRDDEEHEVIKWVLESLQGLPRKVEETYAAKEDFELKQGWEQDYQLMGKL